MDFAALMSQYKSAVSPQDSQTAGQAGRSGSANDVGKQQQGPRRSRGNFRRRFEPKGDGKVTELGGGEYKLEQMYGAYKLWNDDWVSEPDDLFVVFEAKTENDVTVAFTVEKEVVSGNMYEIVIGGWRNTKSVIRTEAQGQERAITLDPRMCSADTFLTYYVLLREGTIVVGTGDRPGHNLLMAWKNPQYDPSDIQPCWVSFSAWDKPLLLKSVRLSTVSSLDYDWKEAAGSEESWKERFVPSFIRAFEEERAANIARAQRFGVSFVAPDPSRALNKMTHEERERARASQAGRLRSGFATGFDTESAEAIEARQARAARFGLESTTAATTSTNTGGPAPVSFLPTAEELEAKRQRAERFGVPITEQATLVSMSLTLPIKRRDAGADETVRADTLHVYGDLRTITSAHVLRAFQNYDPSHLEWLGDASLNVCFADAFTCDRAMAGMCRDIPPPLQAVDEATPDRVAFDQELLRLINSGWKFSGIKDKQDVLQYVLVRKATSNDVKPTAIDRVQPGTRKRVKTDRDNVNEQDESQAQKRVENAEDE